MLVRVLGGKNIELKILIANSINEEIKIDVDEESTIKIVKELIYQKNTNLSSTDMGLTYAGIILINTEKVKTYKISSGSALH